MLRVTFNGSSDYTARLFTAAGAAPCLARWQCFLPGDLKLRCLKHPPSLLPGSASHP